MPAKQRDANAALPWSTNWLRSARSKLLAWYRRSARDLTWRRTQDPYAVWVSEIMLQQTQVVTVERYFPKFMQVFPTIAALAAAPEERVLRQWEGLGYYRRARQLHAAAKKIVAEHDGQFPREPDEVRQLPGIGRYTAGAILSIAFDLRQPILEANTVRLLSRLLAYRGDPTRSAGQQALWQAAEALLPRNGCGQFNQALMELGSLVCAPRDPNCEACPLKLLCPTRRDGLQNVIPTPKRQPVMEDVDEVAVIIVRRGKVLLRKCGAGERWAGLWDFPRFAATNARGTPLATQIAESVRRISGIEIHSPRHFTTLRHGVTRFRIKLDCYLGEFDGSESENRDKQVQRWVAASELDQFPLSTTGRKLAKSWHAEQVNGRTPKRKR